MGNAVKWASGYQEYFVGDILTTELNSLSNGSRAISTNYVDNAMMRHQYACFEIYLASLTPTAGGSLTLSIVTAPDGTNFGEGDGSTDPGLETAVATLSLRAATGTVRKITGIILLPPARFKTLLTNNSGAALASSGNTVTVYFTNEHVS